MTFIWLIAWLIFAAPPVHMWNAWAVALIVCVVIDLLELFDR
jgi:hypothetical protein